MFPASPTDGQEVTLANGVTYKWVAADNHWLIVTPSGGGGPPINTGNTPPATPQDGTMWYDKTNMRLMAYIGTWFQIA